MSGALMLVRTAIVNGLQADSRLDGVSVTTHGGDFGAADLARYSKQAPALVLGLLRADVALEDGSVVARAHWGLVAITKNDPANKRDASAIDLVDAALRSVARVFFGFAAPAGMTVSQPRGLGAVNVFSPELDVKDIAMWAISWQQDIELVDTDTSFPFAAVDVKIDTSPRPDGEDLGDVPESEDVIALFAVDSFGPAGGDAAGGDTVTIVFTSDVASAIDSVEFDGTPATGLTVTATDEITCVTPAHAAGAVEIVAIASTARVSAGTFTYA